MRMMKSIFVAALASAVLAPLVGCGSRQAKDTTLERGAELRAWEGRLSTLFDDSIDPILITDWTGRILEVNRQAILLSGYSNEDLHSKTIEQLHQFIALHHQRRGSRTSPHSSQAELIELLQA